MDFVTVAKLKSIKKDLENLCVAVRNAGYEAYNNSDRIYDKVHDYAVAQLSQLQDWSYKWHGSAVKSIQRGTVSITQANTLVDVTISRVDPLKCLLIVDGFALGASSTSYRDKMVGVIGSVGYTSISFRTPYLVNSAKTKYNWQLVEFY